MAKKTWHRNVFNIQRRKISYYVTSISKNVYIDKLDDTANKCNNKYHRAIKMKSIHVRDNTYINFDKDPKFQVGGHASISKYKNILAKGYSPN